MRYVGGLGNMAICWCHWADAFVRHRGSLWELSVSTLEDVGDPVLGEEDNPGHRDRVREGLMVLGGSRLLQCKAPMRKACYSAPLSCSHPIA